MPFGGPSGSRLRVLERGMVRAHDDHQTRAASSVSTAARSGSGPAVSVSCWPPEWRDGWMAAQRVAPRAGFLRAHVVQKTLHAFRRVNSRSPNLAPILFPLHARWCARSSPLDEHFKLLDVAVEGVARLVVFDFAAPSRPPPSSATIAATSSPSTTKHPHFVEDLLRFRNPFAYGDQRAEWRDRRCSVNA